MTMTIIDLAPSRAARRGDGGAVRRECAEVEADRMERADAEALGLRIQQHAAAIAQAECEFLLLLEEFDRRRALDWFHGLKSVAHWLAWSCSMSAGTAREHVRVARALSSMPRTVELFRQGRLSYSKVREMTRVIDVVDEQALLDLALEMTASQLARTVQAFRRVDGTAVAQETRREARWSTRDDGMIEIRAVLPADVGAEVVTALNRAVDLDAAPIPTDVEGADGVPAGTSAGREAGAEEQAVVSPPIPIDHRRADALVELARAYLDSAPADRTGEDRHLVIVQVSGDALVPPGRQEGSAGSPRTAPAVCRVLDGPALDASTATRLMCTGRTAVAVRGDDGQILDLGRARRLASPAQRRALRLRDLTCRFPGCHQTRHLDAHHLVPWQDGGRTDLENLAMLCRRHHVLVHESGLHLVRGSSAGADGSPELRVVDDSGRPVDARWPQWLERVELTPAAVGSRSDAAPDRIFPAQAGAGFDLAACVAALCQNRLAAAA